MSLGCLALYKLKLEPWAHILIWGKTACYKKRSTMVLVPFSFHSYILTGSLKSWYSAHHHIILKLSNT